MRIGIVIPHLNTNRSSGLMLRRCLKSIRKHEPILLRHTYIIDDVSENIPTILYEQLENEFGCHVISKTDKKTFSDVVNLGASILIGSKYDAMILLNNDIELLGPVYLRSRQLLAFDPKIAVIGAMLLYPNGKIQHAGFMVADDSRPIEFDKHSDPVQNPGESQRPRYIYGVTGAYQVIRLSVFDEIGKYSTEFSLSYEDVEFCTRVWAKGYRVFYDPHLRAIHSESSTRGYFLGQRELQSLETWHRVFDQAQSQLVLENVSNANQISRSLRS